MTRVLAPSNVGYKSQSRSVTHKWGTPITLEPFISASRTHQVLASYKSAVVKSDGKKPTNYTRMISRITPGGSVDANNGTYRIKGDSSNCVGVVTNPNGCNFTTGLVGCPVWMTDKVVIDASADLNQIGANVLEDLGQLRKTGEEFARYVRIIYNTFLLARARNWKAMRRLFRQNGVSLPRNLANGWLAYFYGIKPLISTLDALAASEKPLYTTLKSRKRISVNHDPREYTTASYWIESSGTIKVQAQCQLEASIKMSGNMAYWSGLGLSGNSWTDAIVTAWALVPLSFVFDWFVPVEGYLRSLQWSSALEYQGGFIGKRHVGSGNFIDLAPYSGSWPYKGKLPTARLQVSCYQRETYPYTVPTAALGIRLTLTSTQVISASALIVARS